MSLKEQVKEEVDIEQGIGKLIFEVVSLKQRMDTFDTELREYISAMVSSELERRSKELHKIAKQINNIDSLTKDIVEEAINKVE